MDQHYIGIDVAKEKLDICNITTGEIFQVPNNSKGINSLHKTLSGYKIGNVVIEPTGTYHETLARSLYDKGYPVSLVNPFQIRSFARATGVSAKTDILDARILAQYAQKIETRKMDITNISDKELADLVARRRQLVDMTISEKNRLEKEPVKLVAKHISSHLTYLKKEIEYVDSLISKVIDANKTLKQKADLLNQIKGVGTVTASVLIAELPELGWATKGQIAALVGIAPMNRDSGKMKGQAHIQGGRLSVRCALYMSILSAIRHNEVIKAYYKGLRERGKPPKVAMVACMRKMIIYMNSQIATLNAQIDNQKQAENIS